MGWYKEVKELYKSIPGYELEELLQELSLSHLLPYFKGKDFSWEPLKPADNEWLILLKVAVAMGRIELRIMPTVSKKDYSTWANEQMAQELFYPKYKDINDWIGK